MKQKKERWWIRSLVSAYNREREREREEISVKVDWWEREQRDVCVCVCELGMCTIENENDDVVLNKISARVCSTRECVRQRKTAIARWLPEIHNSFVRCGLDLEWTPLTHTQHIRPHQFFPPKYRTLWKKWKNKNLESLNTCSSILFVRNHPMTRLLLCVCLCGEGSEKRVPMADQMTVASIGTEQKP